jgi:thiol-disulfide isomerase/thioredoxin
MAVKKKKNCILSFRDNESFFRFFNRDAMSKMVRHAVKAWMVCTLSLFCIGGMFFAAAPAVALPLAPSFTAVSLDGKPVVSSKLAGKAYIVNFFASWCPPCRSEIPDMVALQTKYGTKGFTFIGVAVNENEPAIRRFISSNKITYPVVMADDQLTSAFGRYVAGGLSAIPTSFVVNSSGRISSVITGARSKVVFEKIIIEALRKQATPK